VANTTGLFVGMRVASTGIPAIPTNAIITSVTTNTSITISKAATSNGTGFGASAYGLIEVEYPHNIGTSTDVLTASYVAPVYKYEYNNTLNNSPTSYLLKKILTVKRTYDSINSTTYN